MPSPGGAVMTGEQYRRHGISGTSGGHLLPARSALGPAPETVVDGRDWGGDVWNTIMGGHAASAGTPEQAARVSAVYFCVSLIAIIMGSLPREFRDADNRIVADNWLTELIDMSPNLLQTGDEFWASLFYRAALAGQAFAEPGNGPMGPEIWPLDPLRTSVEWRSRDFRVTYSDDNGVQRLFSPVDIFWLSGISDACARPLTPWKMAKGSIDFALALESQGRDFFRNGTRLSGVLTSPNELSEPVIERLKDGIRRWKTGGTPVLEQGLDFKEASTNNVDAQMQELIRQRTIELARYWHIPRSFVSEEAGADGNAEQDVLNLVKYVIRPWARRGEQAIAMRLMTPDQRRAMRPKFNLDALMRGDSATQFKNAVLARTAGTHSANDLRTGWFDMPRINEPWADDPRAPLNSNRAADTMSGGKTAPQDANMAARDGREMIAEDLQLEAQS